jgi:two-component system, NtrC family, sensor kinase
MTRRARKSAPPIATAPPRSIPQTRPPSTLASEIPAAWLDGLLSAAVSLPVEQGADAVADRFVATLAELFPDFAFAVSMSEKKERGRPSLIVRYPRQSSASAIVPESGRVFPEMPHERVLFIDDAGGLLSLHVAAAAGNALTDCAPAVLFFQRAAELLGAALRTTRLVSAKGRESQALQDQIIQSDKLASVGQIAAGIVHELNNPLTSIIGYADYLCTNAERDARDPGDIERLRRISEAATRILSFSRDLITYARPSMERRAPVAIHATIDQAFVFCEHVLSEANIAVERFFARNVRPVFGVRDQLIQVFVNLFTNACHAMEDSGTLSIRTELDMKARAVRISVSDTGHGIAEEHLGRVFEPFFTTKREGHGTGLGLSIVQSIVRLHGGTIEVMSTVDEGTTFLLTLPIAL